MWELWGVEISAFPLTWHIAYTTACSYCTSRDVCADNPTALAKMSPDLQKLLESEEEWGFNVIDLELLTKKRCVESKHRRE